MKVRDELRQFILENFLKGEDPRSLKNHTPLLTSGIIDSIGIMSMINFIEQKFEIEFMPRELDLDRFETIDEISAFTEKKLQSK